MHVARLFSMYICTICAISENLRYLRIYSYLLDTSFNIKPNAKDPFSNRLLPEFEALHSMYITFQNDWGQSDIVKVSWQLIALTFVTVWAKSRYVRTQTEIHFIAPAYSYTK